MAHLPKNRAQPYTDKQQKEIVEWLKKETMYPTRNVVIFMLTTKAALRAGEIAQLCWHHVLNWRNDDIGDVIRLTDDICKGGSGRELDMSKELIAALRKHFIYSRKPPKSQNVILSQFRKPMAPNAIAHRFRYWFRVRMGVQGFSSHSGRRTFITKAAQVINLCGGSLYDVSLMVGHKDLSSTQAYIVGNKKAQKKVVDMI